jgi:hypothetical protein
VSRRRRLQTFAAASLLALLGCGKDATPLTQMVVVVDSDLRVPSELDAIAIEVSGAAALPQADADLTTQGLPRSLGLVHSGGTLGPFDVIVHGLHGGSVVVTRRASVSFREGVTLELAVPLERACAGANAPSCADDQTCKAGACAASAVSNLPAFDRVAHFPVGGSAGVAGAEGGAGHAGAAGMARGGGGAGHAGASGMAGRIAAGGGGGQAGIPAANGGKGGAAGVAGIGQAGQSESGGAGSGAPDAGASGAGGDGNPTNQPPACVIDTPGDGDDQYAGDTVMFSGSCDDPETGALSVVRWTSDLDGTLSTAPQFSKSNLRVGTHSIALCGTDPRDPTVSSCTAIQLSIATLPAMSVSIDNLGQGGSTTQPFSPSSAVSASGSSSGVPPFTYAWNDSMLGSLGSASGVSYAAPVSIGKHTLGLTIIDGRGRTASTSRAFIVNSSGALCAPYSVVNNSGVGAIGALAVDANAIYLGGTSLVYRIDAAATPSVASANPLIIAGLSIPRAIFLHESSSLAFIGTASGYIVCPYTPSGGIDTTGMKCKSFSGGSLPSNDVGSLLRVTAPMPNKDFLLVGTTSGLLIADDPSGTIMGVKRLSTPLTDAVLGPSAVWLASSTGLYSYDFSIAMPFVTAPTSVQLVNDLTSVAATTGAVWTGSSTLGIGRYQTGSASWNAWRVSGPSANGTSLVSDDVRDIAVQRAVNLAGTVRDLIWIATGAGISRFDPSVPSFTTFTTSDGLPSSSTRKIAILANGVKLFASDSGLCAYSGN